MTTDTMLYLAGFFNATQICLCLALSGVFVRVFSADRTRKHSHKHLIDLKPSCTVKRLGSKTVSHGKIVSIYGGKV